MGAFFSKKNENQKSLIREKEQQKTEKVQELCNQKFDFQKSMPESEQLQRFLKQPRSQEYLMIFEMMDLLSENDEKIIEHLQEVMDEDEVEELKDMTTEEILEEIRQNFLSEFQEYLKEVESTMIAVISQCYIDGCDIHAIDSTGKILEHYEVSKKLSDDLQRGRDAYHKYKDCSCVEIYTNVCRVIMPSGEVIEVR